MEKESIKDLYVQLSNLDKRIRRLQKEKQEYFLSYINENDKDGEISVPLVIGTNNSDYEKLEEKKKTIICSIEKNKKYIKKFPFYTQGIVFDLRKEGLSDDEINTRMAKVKDIYKKRISQLEDLLRLIDENPKLLLRISECESCNYSKVNSKEAIRKLKNYDKSIKKCSIERKSVKKMLNIRIQKDEKLEKSDRISLTLKLIENKGKKGIDI